MVCAVLHQLFGKITGSRPVALQALRLRCGFGALVPSSILIRCASSSRQAPNQAFFGRRGARRAAASVWRKLAALALPHRLRWLMVRRTAGPLGRSVATVRLSRPAQLPCHGPRRP